MLQPSCCPVSPVRPSLLPWKMTTCLKPMRRLRSTSCYRWEPIASLRVGVCHFLLVPQYCASVCYLINLRWKIRRTHGLKSTATSVSDFVKDENDLKWYILQIFFKPIAITVLDDLSLETISMVSCILDGLALAGLVVCPSCPSLRDKGHLNPLRLAGCGGDYPAFPCRLSFL